MQLIMSKATAVWLIENTTLTFEQIAKFCGLHVLDVEAMANQTEVTHWNKIVPQDPILNGQITWEEIKKSEKDPKRSLTLQIAEIKSAKKSKKYTPLIKRSSKPNAILWLLKNIPQISDKEICTFLGTTKIMITSLRDKTHKNIKSFQANSPVDLELCTQEELDNLKKKF